MLKECCICGSGSNEPLYSAIVKCQKCGHVFCDLDLDDIELSELYNRDYFLGNEYNNYLADRKALQKNFRLRLKILRSFLDPTRHKHLLEIGCAYGFFLDIASKEFDRALGIDIAGEGILYACGQLKLDAVKADFLKYDFGDEKFDVVCMWDTIEHLRSPHLYLEKMSKHMESGSLIALTTGDINSIISLITKNKWRLIHSPTHLHYFSEKTLTRILDNYGFEIIYNRYCGFYRSTASIAYRILTLDKRSSMLYGLLCKSRLTRINFYLNLYDIMYAIGRKR